MVHVDVEGELDGRVHLAAGLADRFHARLIGVTAWMPRPSFIVEGVVVDPTPSEQELQAMTAVLDKRGQQFQRLVAGTGRHVEWRSSLSFPTEAIAREARAADLVIVGSGRAPRDPYRFPDSGELLLRAGRPVLVVPSGINALAAKRVAIAWKDARESRRAVQDALPFLHQADEVILIEIGDADREEQARQALNDIANYLSRHRIAAVVQRVPPVKGTVTGALLRLAQDGAVDLIVAGAYGHSRLGEWIFGGVTQDLLTTSPICCLFSH
jgi:nucleotide-binding universal stress UspA family protein